MKYQLVLQFPGDSLADAGGPKALEEDLIKVLGDEVYVDGYDLGRDETTLFIFTPDPLSTFGRASEVLERWDLLDSVTAAHRPSEADNYTVIWPQDCRRAFRTGQS
jgi:hypothetical protein